MNDTLLNYINSLEPDAREDFAQRAGTSINYLRKAISTKQPLGPALCINLERESHGALRCEALRSDVDWAYLRTSKPAGRPD